MSHEESLSSFSDATSSSEIVATPHGGSVNPVDAATLDCFGILPQLSHDITQTQLVTRMQVTPSPTEGASFTEMTSQMVSMPDDVSMMSELSQASAGQFQAVPSLTWAMSAMGTEGFVFPGCPSSATHASASSPVFDQQSMSMSSDTGSESSQQHGQRTKPKRKRVINKGQRVAANKRERRRMVTLNDAFDILKERIPTFSHEKKLSRIETLRLAMAYIDFMRQLVTTQQPKDFADIAYSTSAADIAAAADIKPLTYTMADTRHTAGLPLELSYAVDQNNPMQGFSFQTSVYKPT